MPNTITTAQANRLREAIAKARGPGVCRYVIGGEPGCVIAQLGVLEGATLEELRGWNDLDAAQLIKWESGLPGVERLSSYPVQLLYDLQQRWDAGDDQGEARADMLSIVQTWPLDADTKEARESDDA